MVTYQQPINPYAKAHCDGVYRPYIEEEGAREMGHVALTPPLPLMYGRKEAFTKEGSAVSWGERSP